MNEREKAREQHERRVFLEFAASASLPVDEGSVESRKRPEPDIFCRLAGVATYFELARLADSKMNKLRIRALKAAIRHGSPVMVKIDPMKFGLPERNVLRKKLRRVYKTNGAPVDLLLYFDAEEFQTLGAIPPLVGDRFFRDTMGRTSLGSRSPFRDIWVYERYRKSILWRSRSLRRVRSN